MRCLAVSTLFVAFLVGCSVDPPSVHIVIETKDSVLATGSIPSESNGFDLLGVLSLSFTAITAVGVILAGVAAMKGVREWKKKLKYERDLEICEQLLESLINFKYQFLAARTQSPFWSEEWGRGILPQEYINMGVLAQRAEVLKIYSGRIDTLSKKFEELSALWVRAEARWKDLGRVQLRGIRDDLDSLRGAILLWWGCGTSQAARDQWDRDNMVDVFVPNDETELIVQYQSADRIPSKFAENFNEKMESLIETLRSKIYTD